MVSHLFALSVPPVVTHYHYQYTYVCVCVFRKYANDPRKCEIVKMDEIDGVMRPNTAHGHCSFLLMPGQQTVCVAHMLACLLMLLLLFVLLSFPPPPPSSLFLFEQIDRIVTFVRSKEWEWHYAR